MRRSIARAALALALASSVLAPAAARADAPDAVTRGTARKLGAEGLTLYDKGRYAEALEKFRLANQLVPAPTLGVRVARCLEKLGRLVEASEVYLDVTRQEVERGAPYVHRRAQADALAEREKLLPRIPSLEVELTGPTQGAVVRVDEDEMPAAMIGQRRPIDPGAHVVVVARGDRTISRDVTIAEREAARVSIELPPLPPAPARASRGGGTQRVLGWVSIGVGAAGVVAGAATGIAGIAQESSLLERCGDARACPASEADAVSTYDTTRVVSTVGFVVGAVGLAVGVPLLLTAPSGDTRDGASIVLTPSGAAAAYRF
jgi:hypothetical protein